MVNDLPIILLVSGRLRFEPRPISTAAPLLFLAIVLPCAVNERFQ